MSTITITSLSNARTRAADAAVISSLGSYRTQAELDFISGYESMCSSDSFLEIQNEVEAKGGSIIEYTSTNNKYRVIASLPSTTISSITNIAHAQSSSTDGLCINSNGVNKKVNTSLVESLPSPYCDYTESGFPYCETASDCSSLNGPGAVHICQPISQCVPDPNCTGPLCACLDVGYCYNAYSPVIND